MEDLSSKIVLKRAALALGACALLASGCVEVGIPADGDQPHGELNPIQGMHSAPSYKDQEAQPSYTGEPVGMRYPPAETLALTERQDPYAGDPEAAANELVNPVPITEQTLEYGKLAYETTCIVCHGPNGAGNGFVVGEGKYPEPPSLLTARSRGWSDGRIYHVISHGQGRMWSYKSQLYPLERWAVVNYVRALQRADYPEPQDAQLVTEN